MNKNFKMEDGKIIFIGAERENELDIVSSYDIFREMEEFYKRKCILRHWLQETMDTGRWVETEMSVRDAIYSIKAFSCFYRGTIEEVF